jgi:hypothetical protein
MDSNRNAARTAGVLFIIATAASIAGTSLSGPLVKDTDRLTLVAANANQLSGGALLELVAAGASVGIAISLYPVLRTWSVSLALGSVVFRTVEAVMYAVGVVSLLSLLPLSQQLTSAGATDRAWLQVLGETFLAVRQEAVLAGVFAFSVGAFLYYWLFYQSKLIPRWLSGWGIAAVFLMMVACFLSLFSQSAVTSYVILAIPIAVQEMVVAVWLIAKGFNSAGIGQPLAASRPDPVPALAQEVLS